MAEAAVVESPLLGGDTGVGLLENNTPPTPSQEGSIVDMIMERLKAFDAAIGASEVLEIDGLAIDGQPCNEITQESKIKVINHRTEAAYEVEVDTIIRTPLDDLILALETGDFVRCYGVTRIVGYYSRINNWNKSKKQELIQRLESRRSGVGYAVDDNHKPQDVDDTIGFLNKM
ncbi:MAG: anaerobic ribonucleoside-triphosphate reductase [Candidatus Brocadia sp.]|nr:anaerobic ribonucleoside-triphosphate reductase [Candidatus Brocadia sp.]